MGNTAVLVREQMALPHFLVTQNKGTCLHLPPGPTSPREGSDEMVQGSEMLPMQGLTEGLGEGDRLSRRSSRL